MRWNLWVFLCLPLAAAEVWTVGVETPRALDVQGRELPFPRPRLYPATCPNTAWCGAKASPCPIFLTTQRAAASCTSTPSTSGPR